MLEVFIMKKILVVVLAVAVVLSLAAAAFAAGSPVSPPAAPGSGTNAGGGAGAGAGAGAGGAKAKGNYIVKFSTGETQKGVVAEEPFDDDVKAAIELAGKVIKGADDVDEAMKAFFEENKDAVASGIINMGEDAAEGSVKLAVTVKGEVVVFTVPGNAENLGFVVLEG